MAAKTTGVAKKFTAIPAVMKGRDPMKTEPIERKSVSDFKADPKSIINHIQESRRRCILTCSNKDVAVLVSMDDMKLLKWAEAEILRQIGIDAMEANKDEVEAWLAAQKAGLDIAEASKKNGGA